MIKPLHKQQATGYLALYLILSLLFTVSVKLHIHMGDAVHHAAHGSTVAVSTLDKLTTTQDELQSEIEVSLDKFLSKFEQGVAVALVNFSIPLLFTTSVFYCVATFRDISTTLFSLPFAGTPPLRGPPL